VDEIVLDNETRRHLRNHLDKLEKIEHEKKLNKRRHIMDTDPNAPICILCEYCQHNGFLFECSIFSLPEDGKVVGSYGHVYYRRQGHKPKTYDNTPMEEKECEMFSPLIPLTKEQINSLNL
jgi:hypothetical protein